MRLLLEENEDLEAALARAQETIATLEVELKQWKSGAKSVMAELVKQRLADSHR